MFIFLKWHAREQYLIKVVELDALRDFLPYARNVILCQIW